MTPGEMARAREICEKELPPQYDCWGMLIREQPDEARPLLRKALHTITERDKRIEELESVVRKLTEWSNYTNEYGTLCCKYCDEAVYDGMTHKVDCPLSSPLVALALEHDGREGEK